ncbi:MAG: hypothetical protein VB104_11380 [Candidatus Limiplasma sp.]|nr:hypothetical protein [Candidatus Limiplasma sp.]
MRKYILLAADYSIEKGMIIPSTAEPNRTELKQDELLTDFLTLLKECACRPYLYYYGYDSLSGAIPNRMQYIARKAKEEYKAIQPFFLAFVKKWGLFGLLHDEALFDCHKKEPDGSETLQESPAYAIHEVCEEDEPTRYDILEYNQYAARFFPRIQSSYPFSPDKRSYLTQYCEIIRDILDNKRFRSCVKYIQSIDKRQKRSFTLENVSFSLTVNDEVPDLNYVLEVPLVELCQILLFRNESKGSTENKDIKQVGVCHYRRCHRPYPNTPKENGRHRIYCSDECMRNANKTRRANTNEQKAR